MTRSSATIIDGRAIALVLRKNLKKRIKALQAKGIQPRLDVVLVGSHPSSLIYVNMKQKAARKAGIICTIHHLDEKTTEDDVRQKIRSLNHRDIHGILLQLPLPNHLEAVALLNEIEAIRDVDGLTLENVGRRTLGLPSLLPCTPKGCIKLIKSVREDLSGLHAVVIGRSDLVGKPMAQLLLNENCTVTHIHKETRHPDSLCRLADIVVVAVGVPRLVKANWIKPGAIVIDVGINREDAKIVGDIDYDSIGSIARAITPVPGGVGPMTVACLLENVVEAAESKAADA